MLLRLGDRGNAVAGVDKLLPRRIAHKAEADRRARLRIAEAQRTEHVARPARAAGAGRPQREGNVAQIRHHPGAVHAGSTDVEVAVVAVPRVAVDDPAGAKRLDRRGPQLLDMVVVAGGAALRELRGFAEAYAQRRRQCTRAHLPLLPATMKQW